MAPRKVGGDEGGGAGVAGVAGGPAELVVVHADAGELGDHRRTADECVRGVGHDHVVGQAEQQRRARHGRAVDDEHRGHHARAVGQRLGRLAPAVQRGEALDDVGTAGPHDAHQRQPGGTRLAGSVLEHRRRVAGQCTLAVAGVDLHPHDVAALEGTDVGPDGSGDLVAQRDVGHPSETRQTGRAGTPLRPRTRPVAWPPGWRRPRAGPSAARGWGCRGWAGGAVPSRRRGGAVRER